jgi:hypothetical protein
MSAVTIVFNMDNAAFYDNPQGEVRRVMEKATDYIINEPCGPCGFVRNLLDINGTTVGSVTVVP